MRFFSLKSPDDIIKLTNEIGFLPFFKNSIPGFSVEENCPGELWFSSVLDGPWEWKGPIARRKECAYGKFFLGKAGFVSKNILPDFCNFRRDGYDFEASFEDGLASFKEKGVYDVILNEGEILSKELKGTLGYKKGGQKGFDSVITRLQMKTYVSISDFVYMKDKKGKTYGWGVALYSTPEEIFGRDFIERAYKTDPLKSKDKIFTSLKKVLPDIKSETIEKFIGI